MDNVHDLRNQYAADLVVMLTLTDATGGLGYLLTDRYGRDDWGFSLSRVQQTSSSYTTIHEVGHNMGAHHHKDQNVQPGPTSWSNWSENEWSAGWRWQGDDSKYYCDLMTYESGTYFADGNTNTRIPYFSSPDFVHQGQPTGDAVDGDNARTLREVRHYVAQYRDATTLQYCEAQGDNPYYHISRVQMGSIDQSAEMRSYYDFSFQSTDLSPGAGEQLTVTVGNPHSGNQLLVWVDWNDDKDFLDGGEAVYASGVGAVAEYTTTVTAPVGTAPGPKRMRMRLHMPDIGGNSTPCGSNANGQVQDFTLTVTADTSAPLVSTLSPADEATGVAVGTNLVITFDETVEKGSGNVVIKQTSDNSVVQTIDVTTAAVSVNGAVATIDPPADLAGSTGYYVEVAAEAFKDLSNNNFAGISGATAWNFTTADIAAATTIVTLGGGNLSVEDVASGGQDDTLTIRRNGDYVRVSDPNHELAVAGGAILIDTHTAEALLTSITGSIQVNTVLGDDTLNVDYGGGFFAKDISYDGGGESGAPGDKLVVTGGTFVNVEHVFDNGHDGKIDLDQDGDATRDARITYTGLEPVIMSSGSENLTLTLSAANDAAILEDNLDGSSNPTPADGRSQLRTTSGTAETFEFANPSGSLTVNPGGGTDALDVQGLGTVFDADLTIVGDAADTVRFQTNPTDVMNGDIDVTAGNISFTKTLSTSGAARLEALTGSIQGSLATDLAAATAELIAQTGIDLGLDVANVEADSGSGVLFLENAGPLTIGGVTSDLNGLVAEDEIWVLAAGDLTVSEPIEGTTDDAYITLEAVAILVNAPISSLAGADVYALEVNEGGIVVNADIEVAGIWLETYSAMEFNASVLTDGGDASARASDDITFSSSGRIDAEIDPGWLPFIELDAGRDLIMADGSAIDARVGLIQLFADRNMRVGTLRGDWTVELFAGDGWISDGTPGLGGNLATAGGFFITAGGTVDVRFDADWLGTDTAKNDSPQFLEAIGTVTLSSDDLTAGTGTITLGAGTFLTVGDPDPYTDASIFSNTQVNIGATLAGTGTVTGTLTVDAGGYLTPGQSPGRLTVDNSVTLTGGATPSHLVLEINGPEVSTNYDQLKITGAGRTVTLNNAVLNVTLDAGYTPPVGTTFTIVDLIASDSTVSGTFAGLADDSKFFVGTTPLRINYNGGTGNDVVLTVTNLNDPPVLTAPASIQWWTDPELQNREPYPAAGVGPHYWTRDESDQFLFVTSNSDYVTSPASLFSIPALRAAHADDAVSPLASATAESLGVDVSHLRGGAISDDLGRVLSGTSTPANAVYASLPTDGTAWSAASVAKITNDQNVKHDSMAFSHDSTLLFSNDYGGVQKNVYTWNVGDLTHDGVGLTLAHTHISPNTSRIRSLSSYYIGGQDLVYFGDGGDGGAKVMVYDPATDSETVLLDSLTGGNVMYVKLSGVGTAQSYLYVGKEASGPSPSIWVYALAADGKSVTSTMPVASFPGAALMTDILGVAANKNQRAFEVTNDGQFGFFGTHAAANVYTVSADVPAGRTTPEEVAFTFTATATDPDLPPQTLTFSLLGAPDGAAIDPASGVFTWTPAEEQGPGDYTFRVRVSDGTATDEGWMTLRVTEVNDAPAGTDKTVTMLEDGTYTFASADFGFTDPNDIPVNTFSRVKIASLPAAGTLKLSGVAVAADQFIAVADIANLTFEPVAEANGSPYTTFTFQVEDDGGTEHGGVNLDPTPNTLSINVTAVNDAPVAVADSYTTAEDTQLVVAAPGVLGNDTDEDGDTLTAVKLTDPAHGTLIFNANGSFTYTPAENYNGADSFTYKANDGTADSNIVQVDITVTAVNDAPVIFIYPDLSKWETWEDTIGTLLAGALQFFDVDAGSGIIRATMTAVNGTVSLNPAALGDLTFITGNGIEDAEMEFTSTLAALNAAVVESTFSPTANFVGEATITITVNDQGNTPAPPQSTTGTVTIPVTPVNDPPEGTDTTVTTAEDTAYTFATGDFGFTDPDDIPANAFNRVNITTLPGAGTLKLNGTAVTAGQFIAVADIANLTFEPVAE
ncbi:MAG TPA: tandem-95 repeat protein, partial [Candidatus Anammoximicrobium sp.]|nr:tandem-95 repeat protein [Candidatus Anammoximicrobium sp.]